MADLPPKDFGRVLLHTRLRKTKICTFFIGGVCQYGSECKFAHARSELQSSPDLTKTRLCQAFMEGGCQDPGCSFAHGEEELRSMNMFLKTKPCYWHEKGKCRNGDRCRFAHSSEELRANPNGAEPMDPEARALQELHLQQTKQTQQQKPLLQQPEQREQELSDPLTLEAELSAAQAQDLLFTASRTLHGKTVNSVQEQQLPQPLPEQHRQQLIQQSIQRTQDTRQAHTLQANHRLQQLQQLGESQYQRLAQQPRHMDQVQNQRSARQQLPTGQQQNQRLVQQQHQLGQSLGERLKHLQVESTGEREFVQMPLGSVPATGGGAESMKAAMAGYPPQQPSSKVPADDDEDLKSRLQHLRQKVASLTLRCKHIQEQMESFDGGANARGTSPQTETAEISPQLSRSGVDIPSRYNNFLKA